MEGMVRAGTWKNCSEPPNHDYKVLICKGQDVILGYYGEGTPGNDETHEETKKITWRWRDGLQTSVQPEMWWVSLPLPPTPAEIEIDMYREEQKANISEQGECSPKTSRCSCYRGACEG